jgi:hypothetical protein
MHIEKKENENNKMERMQSEVDNNHYQMCALKRENTRIENESNVQQGANNCYYKKCALKKRNVRIIK